MDKKQDKKSFEALKANIKKDLAKNKESLQKDLKEEQNKKIHYLFENYPDKNLKKVIDNCNESLSKESLTIKEFVQDNLPMLPVYATRPHSLRDSAEFFLKNFSHNKNKTRVLYSVKSNPEKSVLNHLFNAGIKNFDVASIAEIEIINNLFGDKAKMFFMHPIKSRESIYQAYFQYGIRDFVLDCHDELQKITEVTNNAKDLNLHLRLAIPNNHSAIDLSRKFGIFPEKATGLLRKIATIANNVGICFHVGSQCMDPVQYRGAIEIAQQLIKKSKVKINILDIGGGFPSSYPAMSPQSLDNYFNEIFLAINQMNLPDDCELWCEPGRALVAESGSLIVRVESRKNQMLYLNDGTYGGLFDAGTPSFIYHTKAIRTKDNSKLASKMLDFGFYGPTCDSLDFMKGPFYLPENIAEGDYIEIGQMGAYSRSIRTDFNGFNKNIQIEVNDIPLVSMYKSITENNQLALYLSRSKL